MGANLPGQFLLLEMTKNITNPLSTWKPENNPNIWEGVECNKDGLIVRISWSSNWSRGLPIGRSGSRRPIPKNQSRH